VIVVFIVILIVTDNEQTTVLFNKILQGTSWSVAGLFEY